MKKSKVILAIALAVILLVTCLCAPTFSWFTRPYPPAPAQSGGADAAAGNVLGLTSKNVYTAYNGKNVTMTTTACTTGAEADYAAATSASGLGATNDVSVADRQYFCTTITNSSNTEQNISLYAANLHSTTTQFALGVNSPMRTYRDYSFVASGTKQDANYSTRRVYFKRPAAQGGETDAWWDWVNGQNYAICYWGSDSVRHYEDAHNYKDNDHYYVDIPYDNVVGCFLKIAGEGKDAGAYRTQDLAASDFPQNADSVFIDVWHEEYNSTYHNLKALWSWSYTGANIYRYYSTITLDPGATFNAGKNWPDMKGSRIEYYSEDDSVFSVDQNTGVITAVGSAGSSAKLYTKVFGEAGDWRQAETTVTIQTSQNGYTYSDVPIVKNLRIPVDIQATQNEQENKIKVYWYIKKNGSSLSFKIDRIYLGP